MKICHLTSVHPRYDIRIFLKECVSLAKFHETHLVVADGKGDEQRDGVFISDVGYNAGRIKRITTTTKHVYKKALELDCDIYHLHDPELLLIVNRLKRKGKKVIFDAHEDVPKQLLSKPYLSPWKARLFSKIFSVFEQFVCKKLDYIITATPIIKEKFYAINSNTIDVNNFPILNELFTEEQPLLKQPQICYVGGITKIRGIVEVVKALSLSKQEGRILKLVGECKETDTLSQLKTTFGYEKVEELGFLNREEVRDLMSASIAGVVTFLPYPNHVDAQPNKMFEYMSASIPVIASNFPLWKEIIEGNNCGLCVNPLDPGEIAKSIDFLFENPKLAVEMGENGRKAIVEKYNWAVEEKKLFTVYNSLQTKI